MLHFYQSTRNVHENYGSTLTRVSSTAESQQLDPSRGLSPNTSTPFNFKLISSFGGLSSILTGGDLITCKPSHRIPSSLPMLADILNKQFIFFSSPRTLSPASLYNSPPQWSCHYLTKLTSKHTERLLFFFFFFYQLIGCLPTCVPWWHNVHIYTLPQSINFMSLSSHSIKSLNPISAVDKGVFQNALVFLPSCQMSLIFFFFFFF